MADFNDFMDGFEPQDDGDFKALPEGKYTCVIDKVDFEKKENGTAAVFVLKVLGPSHAGRLVFQNLWVMHKNPKAKIAGLATIAKIAKAIGIPHTSSKDKYIGEKADFTLTVDQNNDKFNNIKKVEPASGAVAAPPSPAKPAQAADSADEGGESW